MRQFALAMSLMAAFGATAVMAQDVDPTQDPAAVQKPHKIKPKKDAEEKITHGLIQPTSAGSSGAPSGTVAGVHEGIDDGTAAGDGIPRSAPEIPEVHSAAENQGPNPYPNATSNSGMIVGGSVTGTGALNSAHPGQ